MYLGGNQYYREERGGGGAGADRQTDLRQKDKPFEKDAVGLMLTSGFSYGCLSEDGHTRLLLGEGGHWSLLEVFHGSRKERGLSWSNFRSDGGELYFLRHCPMGLCAVTGILYICAFSYGGPLTKYGY